MTVGEPAEPVSTTPHRNPSQDQAPTGEERAAANRAEAMAKKLAHAEDQIAVLQRNLKTCEAQKASIAAQLAREREDKNKVQQELVAAKRLGNRLLNDKASAESTLKNAEKASKAMSIAKENKINLLTAKLASLEEQLHVKKTKMPPHPPSFDTMLQDAMDNGMPPTPATQRAASTGAGPSGHAPAPKTHGKQVATAPTNGKQVASYFNVEDEDLFNQDEFEYSLLHMP